MSLAEVSAKLLQVRSLLVDALVATGDADLKITEGSILFEAAVIGSTQLAAEHARGRAAAASEGVRAAREDLLVAQSLVEAYHRSLVGNGGINGEATPQAAVSTVLPAPTPHADAVPVGPESRYTEWIAELKRAGVKITPGKIVRMIRQRLGRLIWLETGHEDHAGQAHILRPNRLDHFIKAGIDPEEITDLVFECLERGRFVGKFDGADVYEVNYKGAVRRIAVTVGNNGFIVTAYPIGMNRRLS